MIKYLTIGWGVPYFPSTLSWIGKRYGVYVKQITWDLSGLTTFEVDGDHASIDAFMDHVGAEDADEQVHGG